MRASRHNHGCAEIVPRCTLTALAAALVARPPRRSYAAISTLGRRLGEAMAPTRVLPVMVETIGDGLRLPYVAVRVGRRGGRAGPVTGAPDAGVALRLPLASIPFRPGMLRSISTTSGCSSSARATASSPLVASPTSVTSATDASSAARPARTPRSRRPRGCAVGRQPRARPYAARGSGQPPRHDFPE